LMQQRQLLQAQVQQAQASAAAADSGPQLPAASEPELQEQMLRMGQERRELKDYAERVTRELRRYQQARPSPPPGGPEDDLPLPPWATNMQMMSPLLFAYEERISELEAVIERSVSLAEQAQHLAKENDQLRAELHDRTEQLRNVQLLGAPGSGSPGCLGPGQQQEELQELYRLSVEQNEALAQQNQLLKLQLERMQQNMAVGQQQAQEAHSRAYEHSRAFAAEQEKTEALTRQRFAAENRLEEVTSELVELVSLREGLEAKVDSLQHELMMQRQSVDTNKRSWEERCSLAQQEEERLKHDLARVSKAEKEHRRRLPEVEQNLTEATEQLHVARKEAASTKQQAEQMLRLIESMERRLEDISERNDDAQGKLSEREDQVSQLLIEKDRWSSAEEASKRHAERLEARLQADLDELRQQKEQEVTNLKSAQQKACTELEDRLRRSEQAASEFESKAELYEKQRSWEATALERQNSSHATERERLRKDMEDAQQARIRLERQSAEVQGQMVQLRSELEGISSRSKEELAKATAEQASLKLRCQASEQRLAEVQDELKSTAGRAAAAEADALRIQGELQEERLRTSDQLEVEQRRAQADRRGLEKQLKALQSRSQQEEQRAAQLLRSQEALRLQWQTELGLERDELASKVERLSKENRAIKEKVRGGLKALAARSGVAA